MADNVKWLKLMNNMFEDEKIEYIESLPDGDMILNVWIKTLCLASKCNDNGNLTITSELPYTTTLLAHKFKKTVTQIEYAFKIMQGLGMVEVNNDILCVSNWCKYQNVDELERLKEQNRLRVAKCREKKKNRNATVMLPSNDFALNSNSISNILYLISNKSNLEDIKEELIKYGFSNDLAISIVGWLIYKKERKQTYKEIGLKTLLNKLLEDSKKCGDKVICNGIENSMTNNWSGIFYDKHIVSGDTDKYEVKQVNGVWKI
jgi:predicted phage replisome organizer